MSGVPEGRYLPGHRALSHGSPRAARGSGGTDVRLLQTSPWLPDVRLLSGDER